MFSLLRVLSVCLFVGSIVGVLSHESDTSPVKAAEEGRIRGGVASQKGAWPFMVSIGHLQGKTGARVHFCGGVIWDEETILTAAHCLFTIDKASKEIVPRPVDQLSVYLGHTNLNKSDRHPSYLFKVRAARAHPRYTTSEATDLDIAILMLQGKIDLKRKHRRAGCICEPEANLDRLDIDNCLILGWGCTQSGKGQYGHRPKHLQQVVVQIHPRKDSASNEKKFRVGSFRIGACHGDSGGPLLCPLKGREPTVYSLAGIASYGDPNCTGRSYCTPVYPYLYWLRAETDPEEVSGLLDGPLFYFFIFGLAVGVVVLIGAILLHLLACAASLAATLAIALIIAKFIASGLKTV